MKKTYYLSILTILLIWIFSANIIDNPIILPNIMDVYNSLLNIISSSDFIIIIGLSLSRFIIGIIISFFISFLLATISFYHKFIKDYLHPFILLLQTIPNIAIIIITLIAFGKDISIIIIANLVSLPIFYKTILKAYETIDIDIIKEVSTYENNEFIKFKRIYFPLIKDGILDSFKLALALTFKVSIMAELLSQINIGIGKELYLAKVNLEMADVVAWTIIMIIISYLFDFILNQIIDILK